MMMMKKVMMVVVNIYWNVFFIDVKESPWAGSSPGTC